MKSRWLIISYFASIDALAPSHHIDDRLPFFKSENIDINLLTSPCGAQYKGFAHIRVPSPAPSGVRYEARHLLKRKIQGRFWLKLCEILVLLPVYPLYFIEKIFLRLDSTWSWFITASVAAMLLAVKNKPSMIYSTGGPVSAHLTAMVVSHITKIPYIAEFQDPLVHQYAAPGKFERHFIKNVEWAIFRTASAVVFLTHRAAENADLRNNTKKAFSVYAGAVPSHGSSVYEKGETFNISHFGSLGGSRNLDYFFRALGLLFLEQPDLPGCFRLNLYGNNSRKVSRQIEEFPYIETVQVKGKVRRQEAVDCMNKTDVLLLIQNTDDVSFETIPSKVYEYLHTGRPILALVYRNPELQGMLEKMGHIVVQADDGTGIRKGLEKYIDLWNKNQLQNYDPAPHFTAGAAVEKLISLADNILKAREDSLL